VLYLGFWELEKSERLMAVTAFKHTIIHFHFTALSHEDVKFVLTLYNSIYPIPSTLGIWCGWQILHLVQNFFKKFTIILIQEGRRMQK
jgi:hypothetical protein